MHTTQIGLWITHVTVCVVYQHWLLPWHNATVVYNFTIQVYIFLI